MVNEEYNIEDLKRKAERYFKMRRISAWSRRAVFEDFLWMYERFPIDLMAKRCEERARAAKSTDRHLRKTSHESLRVSPIWREEYQLNKFISQHLKKYHPDVKE